MPVDPLSSVLSALRVRCTISAGFSAGAPWGLRFPARNVLKLDAVVRGRCWLIMPHTDEPVLVEEFLLIPELPEAGRSVGLDAARGLQRGEIVGAEVAAMDL